jgi:hypothetical protein
MYTDEQRTDGLNTENARILASVKSHGQDQQSPAAGFRAANPAATNAEEHTEQMSGPPRFLLTGLGLIVPAAALLVPALRKQLVRRSHDDRVGQFTAGVAPELGSPRRRRAGTTFLLTAGLAGGALFFWLRRGGQRAETIRQAVTTIAERVEAFAPPLAAPLGAATPSEATRPAQGPAAATGQSPQPVVPPTAISRLSDAVPTTKPAPAARQATVTESATRDADEATVLPALQTAAEPSAHQTPMEPTPQTAGIQSPVSEVTPALAAPLAAAPAPQTTTPAPTKVEHGELAARIVAHMAVVDHKGARIGAVDRVEGTARIKLAKDGQGRHHHVPLSWIARVDTQVHLDRSLKEARQAFKARQPRGR